MGGALRLRHVALAFLVVAALAVVLVDVGAVSPIPHPTRHLLRRSATRSAGCSPGCASTPAGTTGSPPTATSSQQSSVAFFPTYPLLIDLADPRLGTFLAGVLLTVTAGLGVVLLFSTWCSARMSRPATTTAVALLLLYPYSFEGRAPSFLPPEELATVMRAAGLETTSRRVDRGRPHAHHLVVGRAATG